MTSAHGPQWVGRALIVHVVSALCAAATYVWILRDQPLPWIAFWVAGLTLSSAAPFRPEWGLAAYAMTLYGTPRYSSLFEALVRSHLLHWEALFAVSGGILWLARSGQRPRLTSAPLLVGVTLFGWAGLSAGIAALESVRPIEAVRHSTLFFIHALVLMLLAAQVMKTAAAARTFTLLLCLGLGLRIWWQGVAGLELEGDIGPLVLMLLPLTVALARTDEARSVRLWMIVAAIVGLVTVALTYNRASVVAFAAVWLLMCWQNRRHAWLLAANAIAMGAAAVWVSTTPYWSRIQGAWSDLQGTAPGSVTERLHLWKAGLSMVTDHPVLGVGPGRYASELAEYLPELRGTVAHNSYMHMAAETGLPGLVLYVLLFATALVVSQRVYRGSPRSRRGGMANAIQASLVAYLVAGFFISRHDMVLAYILVGWLTALAASTDQPDESALDR